MLIYGQSLPETCEHLSFSTRKEIHRQNNTGSRSNSHVYVKREVKNLERSVDGRELNPRETTREVYGNKERKVTATTPLQSALGKSDKCEEKRNKSIRCL